MPQDMEVEAPTEPPSTSVWQVHYPRGNTSYWWDLPPEVCRELDDARANNRIVHWVWSWDGSPDGTLSEYQLDPVAMTQFNTKTEFTRAMRRVMITLEASRPSEASGPS